MFAWLLVLRKNKPSRPPYILSSKGWPWLCREAVLNRQRQDCYSSTNVAITKHGVMRQWKLCTRWKNVSEHLMCTIISVSPWTRRFSCPIWNKLARTWTMLETTSGVLDGLAALSM